MHGLIALFPVPERPADIKALPAGAHSILITWRPPLHSNGPRIRYMLTIRDVTHQQFENDYIELPPNQHSYLASNLSANNQYGFQVSTSTIVGQGESTREVFASTQEEGA